MKNKKLTLDLTTPVINLDTIEKEQKFYEYLTNPNTTANEKVRKMIRDSPDIPRRQKD